MNPLLLVVIFVVITLLGVFFATREKDNLVDIDEKIPRGKGKKLKTDDQVFELTSAKKQVELNKILKRKEIKGKKK